MISQQPANGRIPKGSIVSLVVSDGPKPVPIPDVRGMAQDKAVQVLGAKDFEVVIEEDFSKQVARGDVIATDPAAGTELQPGGTIVLTVSIGPEYFDCPNFFGMSVDEARALAEQHRPRAHRPAGPGKQRQQRRQPDPGGRRPDPLRLHGHRLSRVILGAHVRRRQTGIEGATEEARARGADCLQIFISNPRSWAGPRYDEAEIDRFRLALADSGLRPCAAHLVLRGERRVVGSDDAREDA